MIIFTEYVWQKLNWFRLNCNEKKLFNAHYDGFLEVSLLGISQDENNLNTIVDLHCVEQECSSGLTEPTDQGVLNYLEGQILDHGIQPPVCGRFWAHTHPGKSAEPSGTDHDTFKKWFEHCADWGVMYILAEDSDTCTVQYNSGIVFGKRKERMPVFVLLDKLDTDGKPLYIRTNSLFELDAFAKKMNGFAISNLMMSDYSNYHEQWLEELKICVKKKYNYNNHGSSHYDPQKKTSTHQNGTATSTKNSRGNIGFLQASPKPFTSFQMLEILIKNEKDNLNQFAHTGIADLAAHYKCSISDVQDAFNTLKLLEGQASVDDICLHEKSLITDDGKPVDIGTIPREKLIEICHDYSCRPNKLKELVALYIEKSLTTGGGI